MQYPMSLWWAMAWIMIKNIEIFRILELWNLNNGKMRYREMSIVGGLKIEAKR